MPRKISDPRVRKEKIDTFKYDEPQMILSKEDLIDDSYFVFLIPSKSQSQSFPQVLTIMKKQTYLTIQIEGINFYLVGFKELNTDLITFWKLLPKGWKILKTWINGKEFDCGNQEEKHNIDRLITCEYRGKCEGICAHPVGLGGWRTLTLHLLKELFDNNYTIY